jgi:hypothetical protein
MAGLIEHVWEKITDYRRMLTLKDHGRVLRVGKKDFIRVNMKGGWDFWNYGFTDIALAGDTPIYYKDGSWYKEKI